MNSRRRIREKKRLARRLREWRYAKVAAIIGCDPRTYRAQNTRMIQDQLRMFSDAVTGMAKAWESAAINLRDAFNMAGEEVARRAAHMVIETAIQRSDPK